MDADAIEREVEQRKQMAKKLQLSSTLWRLYDGSFRQYPSWLKHCPEYIYPAIIEPVAVENDGVQVTISGQRYAFSYHERSSPVPDDYETIVGTLTLTVNEQLVFQFDIWVTLPTEWYDQSSRRDGDIHAFVDGPWVGELQALLPRIEVHEEQAKKARTVTQREDPKRLEDLKKRFGL